MRISIGQIYVKVGVNFPFSHLMQRRVIDELSTLFGDCDGLADRYGSGYDKLVVYMSAEVGTAENVIKGPAVLKRAKEIEYSIFLPYDVVMQAPDGCRSAMEHLLSGVAQILWRLGIDTAPLDGRRDAIVESICADPTMLSEPWPG